MSRTARPTPPAAGEGDPGADLLAAADLGDDALFDAFHRGTLSPQGFDHAQHVRLAWVCLRRRPLPRVLAGFGDGLRRLAAHAGRPGLYHQTITWTYLLLVAERLGRGIDDGGGGGEGWEAFAAANPDLLGRPGDLLGTYYRPETLASNLARGCFVFPELPTTR